jgi:chemotaxis protein CheD
MQVVVGVADMKVSNQQSEVLVTHALGSCIGVAIYDPAAKVGGILHFMLPDSNLDPGKAQEHPHMFADTGLPLLFRECYRLGAQKSRLRVKVTGGSQVLGNREFFQIGRRNYAALRKIFLKNNVLINNEDVGGTKARTLFLEVATGNVWIKVMGQNTIEL